CIDFRLNLGKAATKVNAGYISLQADTPSASLAQPSALTVPFFSRPGVTVLRDAQNAIKQVLSPQGLVNVSTVNSYQYVLQCFYTRDITGQDINGFYTTGTASPFSTWTVSNPDNGSPYN